MAEFDEDSGVFEQAKAEAREIYPPLALKEMIAKMRELEIQKEDLSEQLKVINAHYDVLRMEVIPEKMDEDGIENIRIEGIGRVSLTADMFVATTDKSGLYGWFKENGLADLIQETVNASTLKAFVKRRIKEAKSYPAECLRVTPFTRASITKS